MFILTSKYKAVRSMTRSLFRDLFAQDEMVQSCPEAGPVKWHQAHPTWFFETFVLRPFLADYKTKSSILLSKHRQFLAGGGASDSWNPRVISYRPGMHSCLAQI
jgi:hypothetical protein